MTLSTALINTARREDRGITFIHSAGVTERVTYRQLYIHSLRMLSALRDVGIRQGDELIIRSDNNKELAVLFWACILGGIIPVPLTAGNKDEHRLKVLTVWKHLSNPFLVNDGRHLYLPGEEPAGMEELCGIVRERTISVQYRESFDTDERNSSGDLRIPEDDVAAVDDRAIAYVQFSSGSTGDPKGVCLTHANLLCNIGDITRSLGIDGRDVLLSWMPLTHDMGLIGFLLTGVVNALDIVSIGTTAFVRNPLLWMDMVSAYKASVLYSPNFGLHYFLSALDGERRYDWSLSPVRVIVNGAENISGELCHRFTRVMLEYGLSETAILTAYGMAEASVEVTAMPPGSEIKEYCLHRHSLGIGDRIRSVDKMSGDGVSFVDVGYPVSSCRVRICGQQGEELPEQRVGNIQIKGENVMAGYYNNPEATDAVFTADGWLQTGDLGFLLDGRLTVTGRAKNIIILNGQNFYPQDIEGVLIRSGLAELGKVVACGARGRDGDKEELVIFVLHKGEPDAFLSVVKAVREAIWEHIGEYASIVIPVKSIPKTTSGKIRHFVLLQGYREGQFDAYLELLERSELPAGTQGRMAPGQLTTAILEIVGRLLPSAGVGPETDLLAVGMNSLVAMQMSVRLSRLTGVSIPVQVLFECNTPYKLVQYINKAAIRPGIPVLRRTVPADRSDLSPAQQRIWMECQLSDRHSAYHIPLLYKITGSFDVLLFEKALRRLVEKYEILRTSFHPAGDRIEQSIHEYQNSIFSLEYTDISQAPDAEARVQEIVREDIDRPFAMQLPAQLRARVIRTKKDSFWLVVVIHHILLDGWSFSQLFKELCTSYNSLCRNEGVPVSDAPVLQFRDYVAWQKELLLSDSLAADKEYWLNELKDMPGAVSLSPRSVTTGISSAGKAKTFRYHYLPGDQDLLKGFAAKYRTTPFAVLMTFLNILLYRYTNCKDISIAFDVSARVSEELESLIGYTLNTLCLRIPVDGGRLFPDLLTEVRDKILSAIEHQLYPFEKVISDKAANRSSHEHTLFSMLVLYQNFIRDDDAFYFDGCQLSEYEVEPSDNFVDLLLEFTERKEGLALRVRYNETVYPPGFIDQFCTHLYNLQKAVLENDDQTIGSYVFLTDQERDILLPAGSAADGRPCLPVQHLFEQRVAATPDAIALETGRGVITYRELNRMANGLAATLRSRARIHPDDRIGFITGRNENVVVAMLGILKAGGAYVAIDPELPVRRCEQIVADSRMKLLLTDEAVIGKIEGYFHNDLLVNLDQEITCLPNDENPLGGVSADSLSYLIYTSGSTGNPKGVMISHGCLSAYVSQFIRYFGISSRDVFIQSSSVSFDILVEEIFPALCTSAKIVVTGVDNRNIEMLLSAISNYKVTVLSTTPLVLNEINSLVDSRVATLRCVISGGDVLYPSNIDALFFNTTIFNTYGPSEATVCATYQRITRLEEPISIGRPISGCHIYILDENGQVMPAGGTGEICIEGNLARGYLNDPELTSGKFIQAPFDPARRLYRSGDLGRRTMQGDIEFVGRADSQVKIRGYRIEPDEITQVLMRNKNIQSAVVLPDRKGDHLIACLVVKEAVPINDLQAFLREWLPSYMIPSRFEVLESIPLTVSGKADRRRLQEQMDQAFHKQEEEQKVPPGTETERRLVKIWQSILGVDPIGIMDNFFELGGNSIKAYQLVNKIDQDLCVELKLSEVFTSPTIKQLAQSIEGIEQDLYDLIELS